MDFRKIRKDAGRAYTTKTLFTSTRVWRYIKTRQDRVTDSFGIPRASLRVFYSEKSPETAKTSSEITTINAGNVLFRGSEEERLSYVLGVSFHELGHRLFTNFSAAIQYVEHIKNLKGLYPCPPPVYDTEEAAKLSKLQAMLEDKNKARLFQSIFMNLSNILEDGREERMLLEYVEDAVLMKEGLLNLRERMKDEALTLSEQEDRVSNGSVKSLYALMDMMLHYARFEEIKGFDEEKDEATPLAKRLIDVASYVQDYVWSDNSIRGYEALNRIFVELEPEIEEILSRAEPEEEEKPRDEGESKDSDPSDEKSESGDAADSESGDGESSGGKSPTPEEVEEMAKEIDSEVEKSVSGMTTTPDDDMCSSGSEATSVKDKLKAKGVSSPKSGGDSLKHAEGGMEGSIPRLPTKSILNEPGETSKSSITASPISVDLDVLRDAVIKEEEDRLAEDALKGEYDEIIKGTDFGECHKGASISYYRVNDGWSALQTELNRVEKTTLPIAKAMARKSDFFEKDREDLMVKGFYTGKKFEASRTARGNFKYFSKKKGYDEPISLAVSVVIDESGSMYGTKEQAARAFGLVMYDYIQLLKERCGIDIPLNIIGHSSSNIGADVFLYTDAEKPDSRDRLRLMDIKARANNRDGLPIRLAMKRLEEYSEAQKLLVVVTDGQPAASGYIGTAAEADLKDVAKHCEKEGIALMVAAIDADKENIKRIYGAKHFVDIKELDSLSGRVIKVIKNLLAS